MSNPFDKWMEESARQAAKKTPRKDDQFERKIDEELNKRDWVEEMKKKFVPKKA